MNSKIHRSIQVPLEYLICVLLIYLSGSAAISTDEDATVFRVLSVVLIGLCITYQLLYVKSVRSIEKAFLILIVGGAFLVIECLLYSKTMLGFSLRMFWIFAFAMILFSKKTDINRFMQCIYRVIISIAFVTLIMYFLVNIFQFNIPYDYVSSGQDLTFYRRYVGFFYAAGIYLRQLPILGIRVFRLQSFFWEPGVYAIYLIFALYYWVFKKDKKKKTHIVVLLISIFLTFSTTGICIGIAIYAIYWIRIARIQKSSKPMLFVAIALMAFIGIYVVWTTKRLDSSGVNGSFYLRRRDIIDGLSLIVQKPIFGWGYKNYGVFEDVQKLGRGSSNGLITLGYTMGIVGLAIALYPFGASVYLSNKKNRFGESVFSILFVLTNMTEPVIFMPYMIFLVVYQYRKCWMMKNNRNTEKRIGTKCFL